MKRRGITRDEISILFAACSFMVFLWTFNSLFYQMQAFVLRFSFLEIIGVSAYMLAFALFESILYFITLFIPLALIALILPRKWLGDHLATVGSLIAVFIALVAMKAQNDYTFFTNMSLKKTVIFSGMVCFFFAVYWLSTILFPRFDAIIRSILRRFSVLSFVYVFLGILGVFIVVIRNIF